MKHPARRLLLRVLAAGILVTAFTARADTGPGPVVRDKVTPQIFKRYCTITFTGYTAGSALSDFPALVKLGPHIRRFGYDDFRPDAGDLRLCGRPMRRVRLCTDGMHRGCRLPGRLWDRSVLPWRRIGSRDPLLARGVVP